MAVRSLSYYKSISWLKNHTYSTTVVLFTQLKKANLEKILLYLLLLIVLYFRKLFNSIFYYNTVAVLKLLFL